MYLTGSFKRDPGFTNIKMCLAALATRAKDESSKVKWPPIQASRQSRTWVSLETIFDLEATSKAMDPLALPSSTNSTKKPKAYTPDLWSWLGKRSKSKYFQRLMGSWVLSKPLRAIHRRLKPKGPYGVVHLRCEGDWLAYSRRRTKVAFWTPSMILALVLKTCPADLDTLLLVGGQVEEGVLRGWSKALKGKIKTLTCRTTLFPQTKNLCEVYQAALDFELAKEAAWFLGHRNSSFSLQASYQVKSHCLYPS